MQYAVIGRKVIFDRLVYTKGRDQMCQHLCTIDTTPQHCIVGYFIKLVPCQLRGHKIINSTLFHDLWKCSGITEHIGQPENAVVHAEFLFEEAFAMHKLADKRFPGCQVAVCLDPHTSFRFPAFLFDTLFYFLI